VDQTRGDCNRLDLMWVRRPGWPHKWFDPVIDCPLHFYERQVATTPRTKVNPKTERARLRNGDAAPWAVQQVGSCLGYTGRAADVVGTAAHDSEQTFRWSALNSWAPGVLHHACRSSKNQMPKPMRTAPVRPSNARTTVGRRRMRDKGPPTIVSIANHVSPKTA
jgi:hypothetical protein